MPKLNDSFTLFTYAFRGKDDFVKKLENSMLWERSLTQPDQSYLFNHVQKFFTLNQSGQSIDPNQAIIYGLKTDNLSAEEKEHLLLYSTFFNRKHFVDQEGREIGFNLVHGDSILSPKIFYVPLTNIGILTFSVKLVKENQELASLLDLNYRLRVLEKGRVCRIASKKNLHEKAIEQEALLEEQLSKYNDKDGSLEGHFTWTTGAMIAYFLSEFASGVEVLSPSRLQAFVYASLDEKVDQQTFARALFHLRRLYSDKYEPTLSFLESNQEVSGALEKIAYGASVEGAVVLVKQDEKDFFKHYVGTITSRTLWTYLLVYHQRTALIAAASDTESLFEQNVEPPIPVLSELVDKISKVQLKCLFEEISHYSQQNDFYHLCYRNLNVDSLFREVKEEVHEIHLILTEKRRKEDEISAKLEEERISRNQRKLEWLLALLLIPQLWLAILSTELDGWDEVIEANGMVVKWVSIIGLILIVILGIRIYLVKPRSRKNDY